MAVRKHGLGGASEPRPRKRFADPGRSVGQSAPPSTIYSKPRNVEMPMIWLTNVHKDEERDIQRKLNDGHNPARRFMTGAPKASERFSVEELTRMGMRGLYEFVT